MDFLKVRLRVVRRSLARSLALVSKSRLVCKSKWYVERRVNVIRLCRGNKMAKRKADLIVRRDSEKGNFPNPISDKKLNNILL